jgi:hypothetical protein
VAVKQGEIKMKLNEENYRQNLRDELSKRKFAHKHYSPQQILKMRALKRKQLEDSIEENKESIQELKPKGILSNVPIIGKHLQNFHI